MKTIITSTDVLLLITKILNSKNPEFDRNTILYLGSNLLDISIDELLNRIKNNDYSINLCFGCRCYSPSFPHMHTNCYKCRRRYPELDTLEDMWHI